jgi:hypothetical protein
VIRKYRRSPARLAEQTCHYVCSDKQVVDSVFGCPQTSKRTCGMRQMRTDQNQIHCGGHNVSGSDDYYDCVEDEDKDTTTTTTASRTRTRTRRRRRTTTPAITTTPTTPMTPTTTITTTTLPPLPPPSPPTTTIALGISLTVHSLPSVFLFLRASFLSRFHVLNYVLMSRPSVRPSFMASSFFFRSLCPPSVVCPSLSVARCF